MDEITLSELDFLRLENRLLRAEKAQIERQAIWEKTEALIADFNSAVDELSGTKGEYEFRRDQGKLVKKNANV